ncbi:MAG: BatA domain-containing protein, partial [Pontiellaceae bacterium]|nr:BatA domain-containing protein [Pontiellaceae bacterium]
MTFLLPHFLWALLGLIPLTLVYLIKVHPLRRKTSAWFLWEGIFQERRAASLLQKLRDWLSLLLMALAFILMVLSLAQPVLQGGGNAERLVLIIDNSLSMNADGRMAEARRAAQGMVRSLPTGGRAAV